MTRSNANDLVGEILRSLVHGRVRNETVFVATAVAYPNGTGVTVRIDPSQTGYTVSDDGYADLLAEEMGAINALHRIAGGVATRSGVCYEKGSFSIADVERATLHVAVSIVANASARAMERVVASLEQPRVKRSREIFDKRLRAAFGDRIAFEIDIRGAAGRRWEFSAGIVTTGVVERLFELVSPTTQAIALANMKISDTRALDHAPSITAALIDYERTDPALRSILSNAGSVVIAANDDVAKYRLTS